MDSESRSLEKLAGGSLILGSAMLAAYAILFPILLPVPRNPGDYSQVVLRPGWVPLALTAFVGVLLLVPGLLAVYLAVRSAGPLRAAIGLAFNDPAVATFRAASAIALIVGPLILCISLFYSHEFSRLPAILIGVGVLIYVAEPLVPVLAPVAGILLLAIGCCIIGYRVLQAPAASVSGR
jgi:hypothetical protein